MSLIGSLVFALGLSTNLRSGDVVGMGTSWEGRRKGDVGVDLLAGLEPDPFFLFADDAPTPDVARGPPSSPLESPSPRVVVVALDRSVVSWESAPRVDEASSHGVTVVESSRVVMLAHWSSSDERTTSSCGSSRICSLLPLGERDCERWRIFSVRMM
uniref:Putative secreted protein n=1 Tax=Ixodes ricinus TaxID=34613 RepID=A0A6B0UW15_IXORI